MFSGPNHIAKKSDRAFSTWPLYSYVYYRFSVDKPWGSVIFPSTVLSKDKTNMHTRTHAHIHTTNKKNTSTLLWLCEWQEFQIPPAPCKLGSPGILCWSLPKDSRLRKWGTLKIRNLLSLFISLLQNMHPLLNILGGLSHKNNLIRANTAGPLSPAPHAKAERPNTSLLLLIHLSFICNRMETF